MQQPWPVYLRIKMPNECSSDPSPVRDTQKRLQRGSVGPPQLRGDVCVPWAMSLSEQNRTQKRSRCACSPRVIFVQSDAHGYRAHMQNRGVHIAMLLHFVPLQS